MQHLKGTKFFNNSINFWHQLSYSHTLYTHSHDFFEIIYVLSGSLEHSLNGKLETLNIGDLRILRPTDIHSIKSAQQNTMHRDILIHTEEFQHLCNIVNPTLYNYILTQKQISLTLSPATLQYLENNAMLINAFLKNDVERTKTIFRFSTFRILEKYISNNWNSSAQENENIPHFLTLIINELNRPDGILKSPSQILANQHYSAAHICRMFKKHTGMSLTQYLNARRLETANAMLQTSNLPLATIATMVGFHNYANFQRAFVNHYHCTPQSLRKKQNDSIE